jgi:hypothetical protein
MALLRRPMRETTAERLRSLADRLAPRAPRAPRRPGRAPLVRLGGRWWGRDEIGQIGVDGARPTRLSETS